MRMRTVIRAKRRIRDFSCLVGLFVVTVIATITEGGPDSENPKLPGVAIFLHCMIVLLSNLEFSSAYLAEETHRLARS
jgi:hypothetical protein